MQRKKHQTQAALQQLTSALGKWPRGVPVTSTYQAITTYAVIVIQPHELWKSETIWHALWTVGTEAKQGSNSGNQTYEPCLNTCKHCTMEGLAQASKKTSPVILTLVTEKLSFSMYKQKVRIDGKLVKNK